MSSAVPSISLTAQQAEAVTRGLKRFLPQVIDGAEDLIKLRAVQELEWTSGDVLHAVVTGGETYQVDIKFREKGLSVTECTCPFYMWCKHAAAALITLQGATPENVANGAKAKVPKAAPEPVKPADGIVPKAGTVSAAVVQRLALNGLPRPATHAMGVIENWFEAKKRVVPQAELSNLAAGGSRVTWSREDIHLYPKSMHPASALELLYCVDLVMKKLGMNLPQPLPRAVDHAWQAKLSEVWEHDKVVRQWRDQLHKWVKDDDEQEEAPRFRLRMGNEGATVEWQPPGRSTFGSVKVSILREWCGLLQHSENHTRLDSGSRLVLGAVAQGYGYAVTDQVSRQNARFGEILGRLLVMPDMEGSVVAEDGAPLKREPSPLSWNLRPPADGHGSYELRPVDSGGEIPEPAVVVAKARAGLHYYVTKHRVIEVSSWPFDGGTRWPVSMPAEVLESPQGVALLQKLGLPLPANLEKRVRLVKPEIRVRCRIYCPGKGRSDYFQFQAAANYHGATHNLTWDSSGWARSTRAPVSPKPQDAPENAILRADRRALVLAAAWLQHWTVKRDEASIYGNSDSWWELRIQGKDFPDQFIAWLKEKPEGVDVELDGDLAGFREGQVSGTVRLEAQETSMDWFDLRVQLEVSDLTLSKEEIDLLLKAQGRWVKLEGKGWRKLEIDLTPEQEEELAGIGMGIGEFDGEPQRLHALQLGGGKAKSLLPQAHYEQVTRRVQEIQTRVTPELPASITATLRPYQISGFHFLAYLTANRFGGILADDMGLGKTVQTLAWLAWLRESQGVTDPALVVCPKSVQENWLGEALKFFPGLRVQVWNRAAAGDSGLDGSCDLLVIHYQQLRNHEDALAGQAWGAVILDEAQAIKNPSSQSNRAACRLRAEYRLALSGTPIENRLMDLWAIMAFAMPGALGNRAHFVKNFDAKSDPYARRRLAARTRPFLLRRTKKEVASDLPERIEEDLICELEGPQAKLYQAELKRARAQLLKLQTSKELDKARFNVLTSLLRLRQICCHPRLVGHNDAGVESAKLEALLELLEPIMEEGGKVLVFSQFVEMLSLIEEKVKEREWPYFLLTGKTDERGNLVKSFQETEGPAVFLISLKAGGSGLNLTAASYVVLCDPWWNPAVEAQAIDRTHRIGQTQTVIAYRLLVKDSIEEKIRQLQKHKGALAQDILGEENFASALTLSDFSFLLGGG